MHELAVTQDVLNIVLKLAEMNKAGQVVSIKLKIGELRDIVEEWMQRIFDLISRNTIAEGAKLEIERVPVTFRCGCGETFLVDIKEKFSRSCPGCHGEDIVLCSGQEFEITGIGVK
jgi:hydrogenase nickel incorporation protein HypA/HybF